MLSVVCIQPHLIKRRKKKNINKSLGITIFQHSFCEQRSAHKIERKQQINTIHHKLFASVLHSAASLRRRNLFRIQMRLRKFVKMPVIIGAGTIGSKACTNVQACYHVIEACIYMYRTYMSIQTYRGVEYNNMNIGYIGMLSVTTIFICTHSRLFSCFSHGYCACI